MENILLQDVSVEEKEEFKVCDLESATWVFKKIREIVANEEKVKAVAEKEMDPIVKWRDEELAKYSKEKEYFSYLLEEYYRREKIKNNKFRLSTPYGKATSKTSDKHRYDDEEAIIKYCDENNIKAIKEQKVLDKKTFKKLFPNGVNEETGEVIPGVRVEKDIMDVSIKVV